MVVEGPLPNGIDGGNDSAVETVDTRRELILPGLEFCQFGLHHFLLLPSIIVDALEFGFSGGNLLINIREVLLKASDFFGYFNSCSF